MFEDRVERIPQHRGGGGEGRKNAAAAWRLSWVTKSYANISEYRLLYRKIPVSISSLRSKIIIRGRGGGKRQRYPIFFSGSKRDFFFSFLDQTHSCSLLLKFLSGNRHLGREGERTFFSHPFPSVSAPPFKKFIDSIYAFLFLPPSIPPPPFPISIRPLNLKKKNGGKGCC